MASLSAVKANLPQYDLSQVAPQGYTGGEERYGCVEARGYGGVGETERNRMTRKRGDSETRGEGAVPSKTMIFYHRVHRGH